MRVTMGTHTGRKCVAALERDNDLKIIPTKLIEIQCLSFINYFCTVIHWKIRKHYKGCYFH